MSTPLLPKLFSSLVAIPSMLLVVFNLVALILYFTDVAGSKMPISPFESYISLSLCSFLQMVVAILNLITMSNVLQKDMSKCMSSEPSCVIPPNVILGFKVALLIAASICFGMNLDASFSIIYGIRSVNFLHLPVASSIICLLVASILNILCGIASIVSALILIIVKGDEDDAELLATKRRLL
ncbi:predicted protein [Naegleria gruberi]|uniref:Predicted protein n=1 Tax=Naegleria gruberi TaxID=5762 RepID=D2VAY5_NAEGR|nr:uncharacterized protein NAEGRDRAFT_66023 [Naegleria gruberi]EFC46161.1 predicted protein [Naegleria gruberi]|eukprot:XP_002678905.1 predicted protein [Naegleria gruberi strain NEG-M]